MLIPINGEAVYVDLESGDWVTPFGLTFLAAIAVAWLLARRNAAAVGIDGSHVDLLVPASLIVGIAGAMLLSMLMPVDQRMAGNSMQVDVRIRLYGVLACSAVAVFVYSRIVRISFRRLLDIFVLPTIAGLAVYRVGCFMAGCCWGDLVSGGHDTRLAPQVHTLPFLDGLSHGVQYGPGSLAHEQHMALGLIEPGAAASLPVYPVQLYESALLVVLLIAFLRFVARRPPAGTVTVIAVCAYALLRFFLEFIRADGYIVAANLSLPQLQSLLLLLSLVMLPWLARKPPCIAAGLSRR